MMRRYSGPRHFTAGCTMPCRPFAMKSKGFAATASKFLPPVHTFFYAGRVGHVHDPVRSREEQLLVGPAQFGQCIHVPRVIFVSMGSTLRSQDVKGRELQVGH